MDEQLQTIGQRPPMKLPLKEQACSLTKASQCEGDGVPQNRSPELMTPTAFANCGR